MVHYPLKTGSGGNRGGLRPAVKSELFPDLVATDQREADKTTHFERLTAVLQFNFALVDLAVLRVHNMATGPLIAISLEPPKDGQSHDLFAV